MIPSTQVANTDIFAFKGVLVFKSLSREVLLIKRKDNIETVKKYATFQENSKFHG